MKNVTLFLGILMCAGTCYGTNTIPTTTTTPPKIRFENATVIDLDEIRNMSLPEFVEKQTDALIEYLVNGNEAEPKNTFMARCIGIAKKIRQLLPIVMVGGGVIVTKLAFLILFSLTTMGLVGLLLLLNVATAAGKLGAFLASAKKDSHDHSPQMLHVHVQPWKSDEHVYSSGGLKGPPYGWDDKSDKSVQSHELYNLYEKLKMENDLWRYLSAKNGLP